jgi:conjugative transposon TraK protein
MGVVNNIEHKIKINKAVSIGSLVLSAVVVLCGFLFSYSLIQDSRKSIYIIDSSVPVLAKQTDLLLNRPVEYKAQIDLFHLLFFTLSPDDTFIKEQVKKALYLIDDSGMKEYNNLKEKGFYNQVISSNSVITIHADSILLDETSRKFRFYGIETINRKTQLILRKLITEGYLEDIPRTPNNPHGVLIKDWRILDNSDLSVQKKFQ